MRLTRYESSWLRILGGLFVIILGVVFVQSFLPASDHREPLADPASLRALVGGKTLREPIDEHGAQFHGNDVTPPSVNNLAFLTNRVLGTNTNNKHIEVDLTNQKVYAYEGTQKVYEFTVSSGKWAPTPTGEFTIWAKVRSQKMEGGNKAINTYYYLPNVPYVMFFYNNDVAKMRGFSFHGTYWHDNFGHPMSHGCVNMKTADAQTLYDWAEPPVTDTKAWSTLASADIPGTRVVIYGETPKE